MDIAFLSVMRYQSFKCSYQVTIFEEKLMFIVHYFSVWKRGEGQGTKINYKMIVYKNIKENKFSIKKKKIPEFIYNLLVLFLL